jgi:ADP-ribose pyrophosphatase YjhB (NUDIX family)
VHAVRQVQRVAVYALATRPDGATLLVDPGRSGAASLPSAALAHGEHPRSALDRVLGGLGISASVGPAQRSFATMSEVAGLPGEPGLRVHTVGVVYAVELAADVSPAWSSLGAAFLAPRESLAGQPLAVVTAQLLGLPAAVASDGVDPPYVAPGAGAPLETLAAADEPEPVAVPPVQRPAVYARVVDADRVLLTRLTNGEGLWTLPGGGIAFGEDPADALVREVHEETGLDFQAGPLVAVDSRRFTGHAPGGRLEDFHGVRIIFDGAVPLDVEPRVVEVGGSTDAAAWVMVADLPRTPLTSLAADALAGLA